MSGKTFEQPEFTEALLAGTGKTPVHIECAATEDKNFCLPGGTISPQWCVSFLMMGEGFSIAKVLPIGKGNSCKKNAEAIAKKINDYQRGYKTLIEALKICMPDSFDDSSLEDWQKDTLKAARKIIEES